MRVTDIVKHSIKTCGAKLVKEAVRRLPYALRQQREQAFEDQVYASSLVLVRKPDGNLRVCVDYCIQ